MTGSTPHTDTPPAAESFADVMLLPSKEGAAVVARRLLARVAEQRLRLEDPNDDEALHDFRVALRQLRSWFRAFRAELDGVIPGKLLRRLRRLARASNESRDGEVQLAWLRKQDDSMPPNARAGHEWLIERIEARKRGADAHFREHLAHDFERTRDALDAALAAATRDRASGVGPRGGDTLAAAVASVVREKAKRVQTHLAQVHALRDDEEAHRARLAGKRARYVLQPIPGDIVDVGEVLAHLKPMQDALGELHDAHVLIDTVARALSAMFAEREERLVAAVRAVGEGTDSFVKAPGQGIERGLLFDAAQLHERAAHAFAEVRDSWLGTRTEVLVAEMTAVADRLEAAALPGDDLEIERKYLLTQLPIEVRDAPVVDIEQGYLPGDRLTERLRHLRDDGTERWVRTVKLGTGIVRTEVEEETTPEMFGTMWPLTEGRRLRKRRYELADGPLTWQIDEFLDRSLVLAEVELPSAGVVVELPAWLAPVVVREVTGEPEFANVNLAR